MRDRRDLLLIWFFHCLLVSLLLAESVTLQLLEYIGITALTILPGLAIAVIVAVLSQIRISSKVIMGVGLVMVFILGMLDAMTPTIHFLPLVLSRIFLRKFQPLIQNYCCVTSSVSPIVLLVLSLY